MSDSSFGCARCSLSLGCSFSGQNLLPVLHSLHQLVESSGSEHSCHRGVDFSELAGSWQQGSQAHRRGRGFVVTLREFLAMEEQLGRANSGAVCGRTFQHHQQAPSRVSAWSEGRVGKCGDAGEGGRDSWGRTSIANTPAGRKGTTGDSAILRPTLHSRRARPGGSGTFQKHRRAPPARCCRPPRPG